FEADDQISKIIELSALQWAQLALSMLGDGSRGSYNQFPKSTNFFSTSLQEPDQYFHQMFRIGRDMFDCLVHILAPNPIFHSPQKKQHHLSSQLAMELCTIIAGGLVKLGPWYLQWGNQDGKAVVSTAIEAQSGFPKCLGSGDGSQICIGEEPMVDVGQKLPAIPPELIVETFITSKEESLMGISQEDKQKWRDDNEIPNTDGLEQLKEEISAAKREQAESTVTQDPS
ncbi:hypothetical protein L208DRAFT_1383284, partial [Tricholoma matsutake]